MLQCSALRMESQRRRGCHGEKPAEHPLRGLLDWVSLPLLAVTSGSGYVPPSLPAFIALSAKQCRPGPWRQNSEEGLGALSGDARSNVAHSS